NGTISTANKQSLTLGTTSTGNILIGSDATSRDITIGSASTTGLSLTDNNWSISVAGAAIFTQANIDNLQLDANTLSVTNAGGSLTLDVNSGDAAGEDLIVTSNNLTLLATGALSITPDAALVTAIDLTDSDLTNALSVADNNITGTAYSILATAGDLTLDASANI